VDIRQAIINIRAKKLPDPSVVPNVGSFFKNPVVANEKADELKTTYPDMPAFDVADGVKLSAGWLIEQSGLKGVDWGQVGTYEHNALVLVNKNKATFTDVLNAKDLIVKTVQEKFGVVLEPEPNFIY